jgi:hypothetical protein
MRKAACEADVRACGNFTRSTSPGPSALLGHGDTATALKTAEPEHRFFRRPRSAKCNLDQTPLVGANYC